MYELRRRGRTDATAVYCEKIDGKKDGALFKALAARYEPCVLVTYDNKMRRVHEVELAHHGTTLAVISEAAFKTGGVEDAETFIRDVVHRWLHRMERQPPGTARRYSQAGVSRWATAST